MYKNLFAATAMAAAVAAAAAPSTARAASTNNQLFSMVVSPGAATCLPQASGRVSLVETVGGQRLHVEVFHMPKNTGFDFFVIQVPNAPFGLSWYQGDIQTDDNGTGVGDFAGIFSRETFIVAPGKAVAPVIFPTDANTNPTTAPVHTHHLGLWFDSPASATKAGCAGTKTPFNGEHNAGIQVLNTANFADLTGPLQKIQ